MVERLTRLGIDAEVGGEDPQADDVGVDELAAVMGSPTGTSMLPGRKPKSRTRCWFSGRCTKSVNSCAASACSGVTHSASARMKKGLSLKSVPSSG